MHSPSAWSDHVLVVGRAKLGAERDGGNRYTDIMEICWGSATDTVLCHQHSFEDNVLRHGQPVVMF